MLLLLLQEKKRRKRKLTEKKENPELEGNPKLKEHGEVLILNFLAPVLGSYPKKQSFQFCQISFISSPDHLLEVDEVPGRWHPFNTVLTSAGLGGGRLVLFFS